VSRGQGFKGLFSKDFISAFNILSISAMSFFSVLNSPFSIKSKSPANNICVSNSQTEPLRYVKHPNVIYISLNRSLDSLNPIFLSISLEPLNP